MSTYGSPSASRHRVAADRRGAIPGDATRRVLRNREPHDVVTALLGKRWSPEQVSHELRSRFPDQPERHLCPASIDQAIYDPRIDVTRPAKRWRRRRV